MYFFSPRISICMILFHFSLMLSILLFNLVVILSIVVFKPISDIPTIWNHSGSDFCFLLFLMVSRCLILLSFHIPGYFFLLRPRCCIWQIIEIIWESQWCSKEDYLCLWQIASLEALALPDRCKPTKGVRGFKSRLYLHWVMVCFFIHTYSKGITLWGLSPYQALYSPLWALNANFYSPAL